MSYHNKNFYIAAYNSSGAGEAASSGALGGARDAKRSLAFNGYSSEEDSPYAPDIRKARALERRRNVMASEETAKSNLLFAKMGITTGGGDSDDDDDEVEEAVEVPEMPLIEEEKAQSIVVVADTHKIEEIIAAHGEELSVAKEETELVSAKLAAAAQETEVLQTQIHVYHAEKAVMEDKLKKYEDQIAQNRRVVEDKLSFEQASAADVATLKTKSELLERQVATLQASGERAEAERSILAAENAELNDKLRETLAQLASTKEQKVDANNSAASSALSTAMELALKREETLRSELKSLHDELSVVENALKASNEAAQAASLRATEALTREEQALLKASTAEEEKRNADKVADEALVEAEYLRGEISKLESEVFRTKEQSEANIAATEEQLTFALVDVVNLQAENRSYKEQIDAACAHTVAIETELGNKVRSLTEQIHTLMLQNEVAMAQAQEEQVDTLKEKLAKMESEASKTASSHSVALFEANTRAQNAEARCAALEKQQAEARVPLALALHSPKVASGYGLIERKRTEFTTIDLETGGIPNYESDSSHYGEERGPLTAFALRFGAVENLVQAAKAGDNSTFGARMLLKRQQSAIRMLIVVYLLALHVSLVITWRMGCAI